MKKILLILITISSFGLLYGQNTNKYLAVYASGQFMPGGEIGLMAYVSPKLDLLSTVGFQSYTTAGIGRNMHYFNQQLLIYQNENRKGLFFSPRIGIGDFSFHKSVDHINYFSFLAHDFEAGIGGGYAFHLFKNFRLLTGINFSARYLHYYSTSNNTADYSVLNTQFFMLNKNWEFYPTIFIALTFSNNFNN